MFEEYLEVALEAARAAGEIQLEGMNRQLRVATKRSFMDLVTEIDQACEAEIARRLLARFPDHQLLAEEGTVGGDNPRFRWVVDPLDGTTNYFHRYPFFCVSIGLEVDGQLAVGVIFDAVHNELFQATAGGGAFLNGTPINVSETAGLNQALLCTGFPGDQSGNQSVMAAWERLALLCHGIRRDGSAALDLCYVACGRLDGFWERLNAWDMAAGALIVAEAGGMVSNFAGEPFNLYQREIIVANAAVGQAMVAALQEPLN